MSDEEGQLIEEIVEDVWDCSSCGKQGIRGRELACPGCGNGREQTEEYREGDGVVVTDQATLALATAGANWACAYCEMDNRAASAKCERCGATKEVKPPPSPEQALAVANAVLDSGGPTIGERLASFAKYGAALWFVFAVLGFVAHLWFSRERSGQVSKVSWSRFVYVEKRVEQVDEAWDKAPADGKVLATTVIPDGAGYDTVVTGHRADRRRWTEKVADGQEPYTVMEQVTDGTETYFVSERVQDGYRTRTRTVREQTGTKKELVRTEKLGNGFSKKIYREVPVYGSKTVEEREPAYKSIQVMRTRTRYKTVPVTRYRTRYKDVERTEPIQVPITKQVPVPRTKVKYAHPVWKDLEPLSARGEDTNPAWPEPKLAGEPEPEREKRRQEFFVVKLQTGPDEFSYSPRSEAEFKTFSVGQKRKFRFDAGSLRMID